MPAATPLPRSPSVVTVYTAEDLLTGPGCPMCRYLSEASDRYFTWFALEAHGQAATITRLSRSLGMCPRHTRRLMSQPGAAGRLTVVYRYLVGAARDQLAARRVMRLAPCPGCEHDDGAERRVLETLLEGLAGASVRARYRELGGLCIPHLRAATPRVGRQLATWLTGTTTAAVASAPNPGWLAGTDHDADVRAVLRKTISAGTAPGTEVCVACLAAGRFESSHLARILHDARERPERCSLVCASHLSDLAMLSGRGGVPALLTWQGDCLTASPAQRPPSQQKWTAGSLLTSPRLPRRRSAGSRSCPVCMGRERSADQELDAFRGLLRTLAPELHWRAPVCVRHLLSLRAVDPWAWRMTAPGAVEHADALIADLNEAFRANLRAHRHEARGPELMAWRRAAAFLDGDVFCGRPPCETSGQVP
jgi:hypothetical protein